MPPSPKGRRVGCGCVWGGEGVVSNRERVWFGRKEMKIMT